MKIIPLSKKQAIAFLSIALMAPFTGNNAYARDLFMLNCTGYPAECSGLTAMQCKKKYDGIHKTDKPSVPITIGFSNEGGQIMGSYMANRPEPTVFGTEQIRISRRGNNWRMTTIISRLDGSIFQVTYDDDNNEMTQKAAVGTCHKVNESGIPPNRAF